MEKRWCALIDCVLDLEEGLMPVEAIPDAHLRITDPTTPTPEVRHSHHGRAESACRAVGALRPNAHVHRRDRNGRLPGRLANVRPRSSVHLPVRVGFTEPVCQR